MSHNQPSSGISQGQSLPTGAHLEEFVIEKVLGSGGFGITYLAQDSRLGRRVVVKENLPVQFCWREQSSLTVRPRSTEEEDLENYRYSLESFEREAATLAALDHPGIVKVLRSFEAFGTAYFVMPFVEGIAFDEVARSRHAQGKNFTEEEIGGLLWRVLDALAYLHDRGIYHRDIKPGNILIASTGEPVLIDFGAARQRLSERSLTVIESAGYTPFEQLQTRGKVGPWSDLYALGGMLYKAITGETPAKAADRVMDDPVVLLAERSELSLRYSSRLLKSIDKAMAPNAVNRFQSCEEWKTWAWPTNIPATVVPATESSSAPYCPAENDLATVVRRTRSVDSITQPSLPAFDPLPASTEAAKSKSSSAVPASPPGSKSKTKAAVQAAPTLSAKGKSTSKRAAILTCTFAVIGLTLTGLFVLGPSNPPAGWDPTQASQKQLDVYAEGGDVDAQVEQAMRILATGEKSGYTNVNATELSRAFELLKAAALKDHRRAILPLGQCYLDGIGVEKDASEAANWLQKAAESGDVRPMVLLGDSYRVGLGVSKDSQKAMEWYGKAAKGDRIDLVAKMRKIVLPGFAISDATLEEAVEALVRRSREIDVDETDPVRKGVPIIIDESIGQPTGKVTVYPNDFQMDNALRYITDLYDLKTEIKPNAILLKPLAR
jgi:serine/threonine protein kinase